MLLVTLRLSLVINVVFVIALSYSRYIRCSLLSSCYSLFIYRYFTTYSLFYVCYILFYVSYLKSFSHPSFVTHWHVLLVAWKVVVIIRYDLPALVIVHCVILVILFLLVVIYQYSVTRYRMFYSLVRYSWFLNIYSRKTILFRHFFVISCNYLGLC